MADMDMFGDTSQDAEMGEKGETPIDTEMETTDLGAKPDADTMEQDQTAEPEFDENQVGEHHIDESGDIEENGTDENGVVRSPIVIEDDNIEDGGMIEDDDKKPQVAQVEFTPYISDADTVQVTNVTTKATEEQMSVLFSFVGPIVDINLFPKSDTSLVSNKVCFVKFANKADVIVALHLSNTVFIDRAVQVTEWRDDWPDESEAIIYCTPQDAVKNMNLGAGIDPTATALTLFNNPRLMTTVNATAADEFRRQICVGNIHDIVNQEQIKQYFESYAGLVNRVEFHELRSGKKTTMDKDDVGHQVRYTTIVFEDASSLGPALQLDGQMFAGIPITVQHTKYSDIKHDAAPKAMSKLDREFGSKKKSSRSRSRSHSKRHRRSRSKSPRSKSHKSRSDRKSDRSKKRSRSPTRKEHKRSHSKKRSRSRSRSKKSKKSSR